MGLAEEIRRRLPARFVPLGFLSLAGALAIIPVAGIVRDIVLPYYSADDAVHRRVARTLAAQTMPNDEWLVFNGVHDVPVWDKKLMLESWLQQESEFRFYLLQQARWPVRWILD